MQSQRGVSFWHILLGILLMLGISYWFLANPLIKWILEDKLSEAYGAEVNIGRVNHTLMPVTASLFDIQLTDPAEPTRNKVQIDEASADVEVLPLLSEQVVVSKLKLLKIQFDLPRQTVGQVYRQPEKSVSLADIQKQAQTAIPTVNELLARSELKSTQVAERARQQYQHYDESLKQTYQALPDQTRVEDYKTQIEQLKNAEYASPAALAKAKQTLDKIKQKVKQDRQRIRAFSREAKAAQQALKNSASALKQAPKEDYNLLKGALTGDQASLQRVTHMVFGDKAAEITEYLNSATQLILPLLQGDQEKSAESTDMPSVWVKEAYMSVEVIGQQIASEWKNITNTHPLIGEPTTYTIFAESNKFKQFESQGQFWLDDEGVDAQQRWSLEGIEMKGIAFVQAEKLSALLQTAMLASTGHFKVENNAVSGTSAVKLSDLAMQAEGKNQLTSSIANVLQQLNQLNLNIDFSGKVDDPEFSIRSDLDNQFAQLALAELTASQQDKLAELKQKLASKVATEQKQTSSVLKDIDKMLEIAQGNSDTLQALLQAQLSNVIEKHKDKLLDKLKDKLGKSE
ncbi:TIGR03545 family protein [Alteromonas ponticola]|uniref:TIGR03545 family protein n=1 Tax=Alteromonas aquimaris TaxID=2998417 RepID=A0ABT3P963_9ALTE|nr:TIGR03545 family protein [Alteromonas aquimaris]MCW8109314.1 TIGR03545 family protein [Alteromonas aquimaris]